MDLLLIRHGRPERIDGGGGPADPGLTELGHRQSKAMADWLAAESLDAIYVSPMARARQTAAPLEAAVGMAATVEPDVVEFDADADHYLPTEEAKADAQVWRDFLALHRDRDLSDFGATVNTALESIVERHRGQRVAVVCHGGVVNVWAAHILGLPMNMFFEPGYTSVSRFIAASSGERSIRSLNEMGHLRAID
jgi:probable phosphoglycerate mutase